MLSKIVLLITRLCFAGAIFRGTYCPAGDDFTKAGDTLLTKARFNVGPSGYVYYKTREEVFSLSLGPIGIDARANFTAISILNRRALIAPLKKSGVIVSFKRTGEVEVTREDGRDLFSSSLDISPPIFYGENALLARELTSVQVLTTNPSRASDLIIHGSVVGEGPDPTGCPQAPPVYEPTCAPVYGQCGGMNWTGPTCCVQLFCAKQSASGSSQCAPFLF